MTQQPDRSVGFIGVGTMGRPMARHILTHLRESGGEVVLNSRSTADCGDLLDRGARWAQTPAEVAQACDVVVYMVPTIANIHETLDGPSGLLAGINRPTLVVVSSTCSAADMHSLADVLREGSGGLATLVDAPVSGGAEGAEAGTLSIMIGGEAADAAVAIAALAPAGRGVHLGPLGAGQIAKACNQLVVAAEVAALAEAAVVAERSGIDLAKLFDLLGTGYAASRILEVKGPRFVAHDHSPSGPAKFLIKDLAAFAEAADAVGVQTRITAPLHALYSDLTADGLGDADTAVVQRFLEDRSPTE